MRAFRLSNAGITLFKHAITTAQDKRLCRRRFENETQCVREKLDGRSCGIFQVIMLVLLNNKDNHIQDSLSDRRFHGEYVGSPREAKV